MPKKEQHKQGETTSSRRKAQPKEDEELYNLPKTSIKEFIDKERRHDELGRLHEVQEQNKVWRYTIIVCVGLNALFLLLAMLGAYL